MATAYAIYAFSGVGYPDALSFNEADQIQVLSQTDGEWWRGRHLRSGRVGYFPANYVQVDDVRAGEPTPPQSIPSFLKDRQGRPLEKEVRFDELQGSKMQSPINRPNIQREPPMLRQPVVNGQNQSRTSVQQPLSNQVQQDYRIDGLQPYTPPNMPYNPATPNTSTNSWPDRFPSNKALLQVSTVEAGVESMALKKQATTRYGFWASYMAIGCGISALLSGLAQVVILLVSDQGDDMVRRYTTDQDLLTGVFAIIVGPAIVYYEQIWFERRETDVLPMKSLVYSLIAFPMVLASTMLFVGVHLFIVAFVYGISNLNQEVYERAGGKRVKPAEGRLQAFIAELRDEIVEIDYHPVVFVLGFFAVNLYLAITSLTTWVAIVDSLPPASKVSSFAPYAKVFGNLLDLNCGILLLPVCRTFVRHLYDLSTSSQLLRQKVLRSVLKFIPLDKSLEAHKAIAWLVLIFSFAHTWFHLVNYSLYRANTLAVFGMWPWISGTLIFVCMLFMYGAVSAGVKRFQFEIFWYSHQLFVPFFILLLSHGNGGFNPNVWKWLVVPGSIYIAERIYRYRSAYRAVALTAVDIMDKVYTIEFDKARALPGGYKEGQYLFINCPHVSSSEWHPFTISSAPQEKAVSLHIRVMEKDSWTAQVRDYLKLLMPPGKTSASFVTEMQNGKVTGPDGKPLFRIYGPHSAPTQHISEYSVDMIIGAGIGVTPVSATLQSIVHHRWKFSIGESYPDHALFFFVCSYKDIVSFRWFLRILKDADDTVHNMLANDRSAMSNKSFEFHLFVTSPPDKRETPVLPASPDDDVFWGCRSRSRARSVVGASGPGTQGAPWTEVDLLKAMYSAPPDGVRLGSVRVYTGRPHWQSRLMDVAQRHPQQRVGVAFCGAPAIGADLKRLCAAFNRDSTNNTRFRLHKENF